MIIDDKLKEKLDWHLKRIFENKEELYYKDKYISGFSSSNECKEIYINFKKKTTKSLA